MSVPPERFSGAPEGSSRCPLMVVHGQGHEKRGWPPAARTPDDLTKVVPVGALNGDPHPGKEFSLPNLPVSLWIPRGVGRMASTSSSSHRPRGMPAPFRRGSRRTAPVESSESHRRQGAGWQSPRSRRSPATDPPGGSWGHSPVNEPAVLVFPVSVDREPGV